MMCKEDVDAFAMRRPFQPFEIRLVDGQRFRFMGIEEFVVGRHDVAALTPSGVIVQVSIGLIATIRPLVSRRGSSTRRRRRA